MTWTDLKASLVLSTGLAAALWTSVLTGSWLASVSVGLLVVFVIGRVLKRYKIYKKRSSHAPYDRDHDSGIPCNRGSEHRSLDGPKD